MDFIHSFRNKAPSLAPFRYCFSSPGGNIDQMGVWKSAFEWTGANVLASVDFIRACEQRAKSFETLIRRMRRMRGDCSVLRWGSRVSLGLGGFQLSMLGHRRRHRRRRRGTIIGNDEDIFGRLKGILEHVRYGRRETINDVR